jgi:hypothetical protein
LSSFGTFFPEKSCIPDAISQLNLWSESMDDTTRSRRRDAKVKKKNVKPNSTHFSLDMLWSSGIVSAIGVAGRQIESRQGACF